MISTRVRPIGLGLRVFLGLLGLMALGAGLLVGARELRAAYLGAPSVAALAVALVCVVIALGGVVLLRGAARGRIAVRRNRPSSPTR